jgi:hypothetical protein
MGIGDIFKPLSDEQIAERLRLRRLVREIGISSQQNDISELKRLFDLIRDKVDMTMLESRVFKIILHDYVEQFKLFQKEEVVHERNYLKFLIFAGGHSLEITRLLLAYPINEPLKLFLTIKKAIVLARRKDKPEVVQYLEQFLIDNR